MSTTYSRCDICLTCRGNSKRIGGRIETIPTLRRIGKSRRVGELYRCARMPIVARMGKRRVEVCWERCGGHEAEPSPRKH